VEAEVIGVDPAKRSNTIEVIDVALSSKRYDPRGTAGQNLVGV
jgi:hypothetical protein